MAAVVLTPLLWPIGVILLWTSPFWNARDKVIGTLLPPGGYLSVAIILTTLGTISGGSCITSSDQFGNVTGSCTTYGPPPWVLTGIAVVLLLLPLCTGAYLGLRLRGARILQQAAT